MNTRISRQSTRHCKLGVVVVALVALAQQSQAATATVNMGVSATVAGTCLINATSALAFGAYAPAGAHATTALDATGNLSANCTTGLNAYITLGQGASPDILSGGGDANPARRMLGATAVYLNYTLFSNAARTTIWGNTVGTSYAVVGTGTATSILVYGRLAAGQNVAPGSYNDSVIATINF